MITDVIVTLLFIIGCPLLAGAIVIPIYNHFSKKTVIGKTFAYWDFQIPLTYYVYEHDIVGIIPTRISQEIILYNDDGEDVISQRVKVDTIERVSGIKFTPDREFMYKIIAIEEPAKNVYSHGLTDEIKDRFK